MPCRRPRRSAAGPRGSRSRPPRPAEIAPSVPPGGTSSGSHAAVDRARPATSSRRWLRPGEAPCSRTAGSPTCAATESANRPVRRWTRNPDRRRYRPTRAQVSGSLAREDVGLGLGHERGDGLGDARGPEREAPPAADPGQALGAAAVEPDHRACGAARRASSVTTTVPRWVVSATPASASRRAAGMAHSRWHASPIARQ